MGKITNKYTVWRDIFGNKHDRADYLNSNKDNEDIFYGIDREIEIQEKYIDNKLRRYNPTNDEIIGIPNYELLSRKDIPISFFKDTKNLIGGLAADKILEKLEDIEKDKGQRFTRYQKISQALNSPEGKGIVMIYADEAAIEDKDGNILHIKHEDADVIDIVENLFKRLNIYSRIWNFAYNICSYGDDFYDIIPALSGDRIARLDYLPRERISRIEVDNVLVGFKISDSDALEPQATSPIYRNVNLNKDAFKDESSGLIYPFRVLHLRLDSNKYMPYGESVLDASLSPIEQLKLMINAAILARVTRSPERRIFQVDVGNLQGEAASKYAYDSVNYLKKKKAISFFGHQDSPDSIRDAFGQSEDIVLPKRAGTEGNSITTLPPPAGLDQIADIDFINGRIFPPAGVPLEYVYDKSFSFVNSNLSSKSVIFSKRVKRVQRFILHGLYKLATIELKLRGYSNDSIDGLVLLMNNPSNIDEQERLVNDTTKWQLIATIKSIQSGNTSFYPDYMIYKNYLNLSDDEIVDLLKLNKFQSEGNMFDAFSDEEKPDGTDILSQQPPAAPAQASAEGMEEIPGAPEEQLTDEGIPETVLATLGPPPSAEFANELADYNKKKLYLEAELKKKNLIQKIKRQNYNEQKETASILSQVDKAEEEFNKLLKLKTVVEARQKEMFDTNITNKYATRLFSTEYLENEEELNGLNEFIVGKKKLFI